ncbi:hypothetical protein IWQ56_000172 [Coemansia nantahalensis]|nr:hypothetical protein IWQ56_000172 [Coemansia nantahalensis]
MAAPLLAVRSGSGVDHSNTNSGDQKEGVLTDASSSGGNSITNPVGNSVTKENQNVDVHDNSIGKAVVNTARGTTGSTVVGNDSTLSRRAGSQAGSMNTGASASGATVTNPQNNELTQTNQNADVSGNTFKDATLNGITGNKGPAMAGNDDVFVPTTNEKGAIQFADDGFVDKALSGK